MRGSCEAPPPRAWIISFGEIRNLWECSGVDNETHTLFKHTQPAITARGLRRSSSAPSGPFVSRPNRGGSAKNEGGGGGGQDGSHETACPLIKQCTCVCHLEQNSWSHSRAWRGVCLMDGTWWTAHADSLSELPRLFLLKGKYCVLHPSLLISPSSFQCVIPLTLNDARWSILEKNVGFISCIHLGKEAKENVWEVKAHSKKKQKTNLESDWIKLLFVTFKEDQSDFYFKFFFTSS